MFTTQTKRHSSADQRNVSLSAWDCAIKITESDNHQCLNCSLLSYPRDMKPHKLLNECLAAVKEILNALQSEDVLSQLINCPQIDLSCVEPPAVDDENRRTVEKYYESIGLEQEDEVVDTCADAAPSSTSPALPDQHIDGDNKQQIAHKVDTIINKSLTPKQTPPPTKRTFKSAISVKKRGRKASEKGRSSSPALSVISCAANSSQGRRSIKATRGTLGRNAKGETLLHRACQNADLLTVRQLLSEENADANVRENSGWTPLHDLAATPNQHQPVDTIVEELLQSGAIIDAAGFQANRPLHVAAEHANVAVVKSLLHHGADPAARNIFGEYPMDVTSEDSIRSILKKAMHDGVAPRSFRPRPAQIPPTDSPITVALACSLPDVNYQKKLNTLFNANGAQLTDVFNKHSTHLVVEASPDNLALCSNYTVLMAVAGGAWVLNKGWLDACVEANSLVKEKPYEVRGIVLNGTSCLDGPKLSRQSRTSLEPGLFAGCQFVFKTDKIRSPLPNTATLKNLIEMAGGAVLKREPLSNSFPQCYPFHADETLKKKAFPLVQLYDPSDDLRKLEYRRKSGHHDSVPSCLTSASWVVDCLARFQFIPLY